MLIDALLDDGDLDAAWREAVGRADDRQWQQLADLPREPRPADALGVYLRLTGYLAAPRAELRCRRKPMTILDRHGL
ncbi:hypothetical protein [Streptomyces sp. UG1]|uniref:hypothetical protein n=1 Tax=Streptomyces sp. UG1 TaxID=3417652 RepID=UPI003CF3ED3A